MCKKNKKSNEDTIQSKIIEKEKKHKLKALKIKKLVKK